MELTKIAGGNCKDGDCATVYRTDRGTIAVQGDRLSHPIPDHEAIVETPSRCWQRPPVRLEGEAWSRYFRDFASSAFRLELRQVYTMPGEADELRRFRAGEQPPPGYHYGWLDTVAEARQAGKTMRRVRVVKRPLTDYTQYEFAWGYACNVEAGEDIL